MNESTKILVVEDDDQHMTDVQAMLAEETLKYPFAIEVVYARDFASAMAILDEGGVDGVLSDVFYPVSAGGAADVPSGQRLAECCLERGLPVVLCTSTYHHSKATEPVHQWARSRNFQLFDVCVDWRNSELQADHKPWDVAFMGLMILITSMREIIADIDIQNGCVVGDYAGAARQIMSEAPPLSPVAQKFVDRGFPRDPELDKLPLKPDVPQAIG